MAIIVITVVATMGLLQRTKPRGGLLYGKAMNLLLERIAAFRSLNLRNRVLDLLGGPRAEDIFKYEAGDVMQDKGSADSGDTARTYRITGRRLFSGQPYYRLIEAATETELGLFHEDSIEPYEPLPENQARRP